MKITVLGCGGGIGTGAGTTALLIDEDILIDAGSGVTRLSCEQLAKIDHVFLTHSHLDHILGLPLLLDTVAGMRERPVIVHGLQETLTSLQTHIFNWAIWPDFAVLPDRTAPVLAYAPPLNHGHSYELGRHRQIKTLPVNHAVAATGFALSSGANSLVFSGDTGPSAAFWDGVQQINDLAYLIIEASFTDAAEVTALAAQHYIPAQLAMDLARLNADTQIYITHLKPGQEAEIMQQIQAHLPLRQLYQLHADDEFTL